MIIILRMCGAAAETWAADGAVTMCVPPRTQGRSFPLRSDELFTAPYTHTHTCIYFPQRLYYYLWPIVGNVHAYILCTCIFLFYHYTCIIYLHTEPPCFVHDFPDAAGPLIRKRRSIARALPVEPLPPPLKFVFIQLVFRSTGKFVRHPAIHQRRIQCHKGS